MGGTLSKIDDDESVSRCKLRRQFMKEAVSSRNAFAAAHSAYSKSLKNTGAALSDYAHSDFSYGRFSIVTTVPAAPARPKIDGEELESESIRKSGMRGRTERRSRKSVSLMQIFENLDDHFFKASECAREVSVLLEAKKMNRRFNFADNREENEDHATLSDKMLAWEKKLYDEVKAMKRVYQNKAVLLNKQKNWGSNRESVDATVAEINHLRDDHLYPKLIQLVDGMATMWETMRDHHEIQSTYVHALKSFDRSQAKLETSEYHFERTIQLCEVVRDWHAQFCGLIDYQKDYVRALYNWLKLYPIPIETNSKDPVFQNPPIYDLVIAWNDDLEKLPDEVARSAISNFSAAIQTIVYLQEGEMKQRAKIEATRKGFECKGIQFQLKNGVTEELNPVNIGKVEKDPVLISLRRRLDEEEEQYQRICRQVREKSLANLKQHLPELFRALSEFGLACSVMYSNLKSVAENE